MGFEAFQVRLQNPQQNAAAIEAFLLSLPQISIDRDALHNGDSKYFLWNDGHHIVEIELDLHPASLSTRFMLCSPESITHAYLELLLLLQQQFGGQLVICDTVPESRPHEFAVHNRSELPEVLRQSIDLRRAAWVRQFGSRVMTATSRDVYANYILPICRPATSTLTTNH